MQVRDEPTGIFKHGRFNVSALCQLASELRGQPCSCDPSQVPISGSLNWTVLVLFSDRVEWVFRVPQDDDADPALLKSEAATLKYIRAHSNIPVPEVFAYSYSKDNKIGVPFILMSKARGFLLRHAWNSPTSKAFEAGLSKIMFQLGSITRQLSTLRFDQIGSLFEEKDGFRIKSCLSRGLMMNERHSLENLHRGPFTSEKEYYDALVMAFNEQAQCLRMNHHCFFAPVPAKSEYHNDSAYLRAVRRWNDFVTLGSKIDGSDNRLDYVIAGEAISDILSDWADSTSRLYAEDSSYRFPLYHPDLNVNNIFIDDEYNITCLIDWAFCSSVPLSVLLAPPGLPQSRNEVDRSLLPAFDRGFLNAGHNNSRKNDIWILNQSRPMWLISRLLDFDSITDYHLFKDLWDSFGPQDQDLSGFFVSKYSSKFYKALRDELKSEDEPATQVARSETQYFRDDVCGLTISRKLTLVSEWFSRSLAHGIRKNGTIFVADKKLWLWIDECLKPQ